MTARRAGVPLTHPGPRAERRIVSVPARTSVVHAALPPGAGIAESLHELTESAGCRSASVELAHGTLGRLRYVHPAIGAEGEPPATYSETLDPAGPGFVLGGSATVGTRDGRGYTHLHATWLDGEGTHRGGHVLPGATVGAAPISVTLRAVHGAELVSQTDPETAMPTFTPRPLPATSAAPEGAARAVLSRVRPGVDLHDAVFEVARGAGFACAVVRAGLGSIVGARLRTGPGRVTEADWPASEVTMLTGTVTAADTVRPRIVLAATLVDLNGEVHSGLLLPRQNPVAVTFELYLEEAPQHARE